MKYLKIFTDFRKNISRLTMEERGALFTAMLEYAETGEEPTLEGREDVVWPIAQEQIDKCREAYDAKVNNVRKAAEGRVDDNETISERYQDDIETISDRYQDDSEDKEQRTKNKEQRTINKEQRTKTNGDTVTRASALDRRFDIFWAAYPKKVGKQDAFKAFARAKVTDDLLDTMLTAIQQQRASPQWQKDGGRFIPNPATWIRQGRWEDEVQQAQEDPRLAMLRQIGAELDAERGVYA